MSTPGVGHSTYDRHCQQPEAPVTKRMKSVSDLRRAQSKGPNVELIEGLKTHLAWREAEPLCRRRQHEMVRGYMLMLQVAAGMSNQSWPIETQDQNKAEA